jgi:hypothetical protein
VDRSFWRRDFAFHPMSPCPACLANSATKSMLLRLLRELGHLLPLCGRLDARESAVLAEELVADTAAKQGISRGQLTLRADRSSSMTSRNTVLLLPADFGVSQSHVWAQLPALPASQVADTDLGRVVVLDVDATLDNPFSETVR